MVGRSCRTYPNSDVDLPHRRYVDICHDEELLLLRVQRIEVKKTPVVSVVLEPPADLPSEVVTYLGGGREAQSLFDVRSMKGSFQGRIDSEIPAAKSLIDDGPDLPRPGIGRIHCSLIADLGREAESDREVPAIRRSDPRANVISHPLDATSILFAGKDVE